MMYGWGNQGWGAGMWIIAAIAMIIFWAIVVFGVVALVRSLGHRHDIPAGPQPDTATAAEVILRERLARGEIDEEQFRKTLAVLREGR